ncbi:hypothetical protein HYY75_13325 [bacterium]|nr:hypothetical protein [bacterium]
MGKKRENGVRFFRMMVAGLFFSAFLFSGCGKNYDYYSLVEEAEKALHDRKITQTLEIYTRIFNIEKKQSEPMMDRLRWSFYRLGVLHEVSNKVKLAKGYYWGDRVEKGYYSESSRIAHFAEEGWKLLDNGNPPRSIEVILGFEAREPEENNPASITQKPEKPQPIKSISLQARERKEFRSFDRGSLPAF